MYFVSKQKKEITKKEGEVKLLRFVLQKIREIKERKSNTKDSKLIANLEKEIENL